MSLHRCDANKDTIILQNKQKLTQMVDDLMNLYASDQCSEESVNESHKRVMDAGGMLAFFSEMKILIDNLYKIG